MKLKILPPTLRLNYRYLAIEIKSKEPLNRQDFFKIITDSCLRFSGELGFSNFYLRLIDFYDNSNELKTFKNLNSEFYFYNGLIRCQRNYETEFRSALAMINVYKNNKIAISCIGKSGTIKSARSKFLNVNE
ncbi:MAG: ribonuclease P [Methanobrevibacter sp.]|jgi:ribonuclease P/MRP protein subunit POP5|nr:ribonuclease P [Candidatus Methanoflexus mossambicus]